MKINQKKIENKNIVCFEQERSEELRLKVMSFILFNLTKYKSILSLIFILLYFIVWFYIRRVIMALYVFFILIFFIYLFFLIKKLKSMDDIIDSKQNDLESNDFFYKFSILICAHNEESVIENTLKKIIELNGNFEIIIVDDRSEDKTGKIVDDFVLAYKKEFDSDKEIKVLHRTHDSKPGKSASLNDGIELCSGDYVVMLDADSYFIDRDALVKISNFINKFKPDAIQLRKVSSNPNYNLISYLSYLELCLDSFMQKSRNAFGGAVELRGSGMVISREVLKEVHGFDEESITDDLEMSSRLFFNRKKIVFLEEPFVYEQTVFDLLSWWTQRFRWLEGSLRRYIKYSALILRRAISNRCNNCLKEISFESTKSNLDFFLFFISEFLIPFFAILSMFEEIGLLIFGKGDILILLVIILSYPALLFPISMFFLKDYFNIGFMKRILLSLFFSLYMLTWMFIMFFVFKRVLFDNKPSTWVSPKRLGGV
ncbi:1,2-diacylglycerol 3-beta-glucosyltransferase [Thermodesulfobium acidiphilum]|uniref:1,2-diacylglycerol 3-beta-glucosyltransferase n=1 Tax=Thermodesulfobium acidiphilum TaxID=1794699 RepID=A0A2R4W1Y3_THEAF|nr:glycosyltransferase [Thermodesulfobium acidiphilum]AWB10813.1 1,2-diacylglycerol 3-beta-glucosyltransferase [Thermodesulfobium acidiphilum]